MNHKLPCELIRDLFPSYIDGLTSKVTNELVEEQVSECRSCREVLEDMKMPAVLQDDSRRWVMEIKHRWHDGNCIKVEIREVQHENN